MFETFFHTIQVLKSDTFLCLQSLFLFKEGKITFKRVAQQFLYCFQWVIFLLIRRNLLDLIPVQKFQCALKIIPIVKVCKYVPDISLKKTFNFLN
jgi:hypothetical protein